MTFESTEIATARVLEHLGLGPDVLSEKGFAGSDLEVRSPIDGAVIGSFAANGPERIDEILESAQAAFRVWREVPAPRRGELVRRFGEELRRHKDALGELVTLEVGKVTSEGRGEVQEMIDVCDFAVGLSRQLYGLTMTSERAGHRLMEQWHPLGPVGVITAFNFPVAVWAWNTALALVCGNPVVWKPSEKAPICAIACQAILDDVIRESAADLVGTPGRDAVILALRSIRQKPRDGYENGYSGPKTLKGTQLPGAY